MGLDTIKAFWVGLKEVLLLREAERIAESRGEQQTLVASEARQARAYLRSARRVASPDVALSMLDVALPKAIAAAHAAQGVEPADASRAIEQLANRRIDADRFADREALRDEVERAIEHVLRSIETRSVLAIRALRYGRIAALAFAVLLVGNHVARSTFLVHDVALHKPVTSSPLKVQIDPDAVVDGKTRGTYGIHTEANPHAFVMVDLQRAYDVREVRIYNRGDGWFDDILPLTLSISTDGTNFQEIATRTTHFDVWNVPLDGRSARWVRVSKDGYIALNEIEVYAR